MNTNCRYCGSARHTTDWCPGTWGGSARRMRRDNLRCSYCGGTDHNTDACRKKWPGPNPSYKERP